MSPEDIKILAFEALLLKVNYLHDYDANIVEGVLNIARDYFKIQDDDYIVILDHLIVFPETVHFRWTIQYR